jgi:hypothetical protein
MIESDKKDQICLGENVFVVPRIRNIMKHLADRQFGGRKWGPAKVIKILNEKKFCVL